MSRALACIGAFVAIGCTTPNYGDGHLQCAPATRACPSGFYCAGDDHCWRDGSGPSGGGELGAGDDLAAPLDLAFGAAGDLGATPSSCSSTNALLCEGFESALLSWGQSTTNGTIMRDSTRAYRGRFSLDSHVTASSAMSGPRAVISETRTFPVASTLYVRLFAWFPSGLPNDFEQFLVVADNGNDGISLGTANGHFVINNYTVPKYYNESTTAVPLDRWVCVQIDLAQPGGVGPVHVSIDGTAVADLGQASGTLPPFTVASFGLDFFGNTNPVPTYDAWLDEIIVDTKPTSCSE